MAMFTAWFDASGHPDASGRVAAYYVCGFVSTVEKWTKLEDAWPALLKEHRIPSPLHMAAFMARRKGFEGWQGNDADRDDFRLAAARLLKRYTNKPFAVGVVIPDLRRMHDEFVVPTDQPREPYPWCGLRAYEHLAQWAFNRVKAKGARPSDKMEVLFEHGDEDRGQLADILWAKHKRAVTFRKNPQKELVPFQTCDFLAWEFRNWMTTRERGMVLVNKANDWVHPHMRQAAKLRAADLIKPHPVIQEVARLLPADALTYANWERKLGHSRAFVPG
jgi:hypothetical protein